MKRLSLILLFVLQLFIHPAIGQEPLFYHFKFEVPDKQAIDKISLLISVDRVMGTTIYAYANQKEFKSFKELGIPYSILDDSKEAKALEMATTVAEMALWNRYPTYEVYEQMMEGFAASHPGICKLVEIGTLASGRKLLAVKISDDVDNEWEPEPHLLYTSTMHGDEIAGFVLMLRLIDELLNEYTLGTSPGITKLVNESVIWINPLANPNGTYKGGNQTVAGAIRNNNNYIDLNRNYPDPAAGDHPDGNSWQEETQFMRVLANNYPFSLSANIHSGTEVVNYPWDTWSTLSADDLWWKYVGGNYRDSAQTNSPIGYFNGVTNGLTNGYAWYTVKGGRQDYMNYFKHCREFTLEISDSKLYPTSSLNNLWNYNRAALLGYLNEGLNGVQGTVTNSNGEPVEANVTVLNHDFTHSEVYSQPKTGFFARYLKGGNYNFRFSALGYTDVIIPNVTVVDGQQTLLNVIQQKPQELLCLSMDTIEMELLEASLDSSFFLLKNCGNIPLVYTLIIEPDTFPKWLEVNKTGNSIPVGATDTIKIKYNAHSLISGTYFSHVLIQSDQSFSVPVTLKVVPFQTISLIPDAVKLNTTVTDSIMEKVWIVNNSNTPRNLKYYAENSWLVLSDSSMDIAPYDSSQVGFYVPSGILNTGFYKTNILIKGDARALFPIEITVDTLPLLHLLSGSGNKEVLINSVSADTVWITNKGGGIAHVGIVSNSDWLQPDFKELDIFSKDTVALILNLKVDELEKGNYYGEVTFSDALLAYTYTLQVTIDTLPILSLENDSLLFINTHGSLYIDTLNLTNTGGGILDFTILEPNPNTWLTIDRKQGNIASGETKKILLAFDTRNLTPGNYASNLAVNERDISLGLTVLERPMVNFNKLGFMVDLSQNELFTDTLVISNPGNNSINYSLKIEDTVNQPWIQLHPISGTILAGGTEPVVLHFSSSSMPTGIYRTHLEIDIGTVTRLPLVLQVKEAVK